MTESIHPAHRRWSGADWIAAAVIALISALLVVTLQRAMRPTAGRAGRADSLIEEPFP